MATIASALAPRTYVDNAQNALEVEALFARGWLAVGRSDQLAGAGSYLTVDIGANAAVLVRRVPAHSVSISRLDCNWKAFLDVFNETTVARG